MVNSGQAKKKGKPVIVSRVSELKAVREREVGDVITAKEIAQATNISEHTIAKWLKPLPMKRFETATVLSLCEYFNCDLSELLHIEYRSE